MYLGTLLGISRAETSVRDQLVKELGGKKKRPEKEGSTSTPLASVSEEGE